MWTVTLTESINLDHGLDIQQVWSEVYNLWQSGHPTYLPKELEQELNYSNSDYEGVDPMKEKLLTFYDWSFPDRKLMTATQVLERLGYKNPNNADAKKMSKILKEVTGDDAERTKSGRFYKIPRVEILNN